MKKAEDIKMSEKNFVEKELSKLLEITLRLENELEMIDCD